MFPPTPQQTRQLGLTLRAMREAAGIGVRQMGDLVGVSHTTILRFENGTRIVSAEVLLKIAEVLANHASKDDAA